MFDIGDDADVGDEPIAPKPSASTRKRDDDEFKITEGDDTYTLEPETAEADEPEPEEEPEPVFVAPKPPPKRSAPKRPPAPPVDNERGKFRTIVFFLLLCVMAYGMLTSALLASPALTDRFVRGLPLIGNALGGDRLMSRKIALSDVAGSYQRIKDGKEVFVITGKAFNTASVALQGVQVLGKLFNSQGVAVDQKTIYCGNVISAKVLRDLTPRELSILQQLNPPKQFMVDPGESSTFVIVFMDPPKGAVEFSAQVVAAQRQA